MNTLYAELQTEKPLSSKYLLTKGLVNRSLNNRASYWKCLIIKKYNSLTNNLRWIAITSIHISCSNSHALSIARF